VSGPPAAKHDEIGRLSRSGDLVVNDVTGERVVTLVGTGDGRGDRLAAELRVRPGGAVAGEHRHPTLTERFRVVSGTLEASLDGEPRTLQTGADVTIPPGMVHDWWNAGDEEARVLVEVTPGRRFEIMVTTLFGLANDGKSNDKGMPSMPQLALIAREFSDVVRFVKPPPAVQTVLFAPLAMIGRARGMKPYYPEYLEPAGREQPDPELVAMIA
jgi:quercetin dioxygenase-like cupin family protein